jgi:hypothetical protein
MGGNDDLTETLRPNGSGSLTQWNIQYPSSGEHWDKCDESTPDDMATYVQITALDSACVDLYSLQNGSGAGVIKSVKVVARTQNYGGTEDVLRTARVAVRTHGSYYYGPEESIGHDVWHNLSVTYPQNPFTNADWTWDEVNDLQAGLWSWYRYDFQGKPTLTQVYVEVVHDGIVSQSDSGAFADMPLIQGRPTASDSGALSNEWAEKVLATAVDVTDAVILTVQESVAVVGQIPAVETPYASEFFWRQKGRASMREATTEVELPHVTKITATDEPTIDMKKIQGAIPKMKLLGKIGRTITVEGWTENEDETFALDGLVDGRPKIFTHPNGETVKVIAKQFDPLPFEKPYPERKQYRLTLLEST